MSVLVALCLLPVTWVPDVKSIILNESYKLNKICNCYINISYDIITGLY